MTKEDLNDWLLAAEQTRIRIVLGPKPGRSAITLTRDNVDSLIHSDILRMNEQSSST